MHRYTEKTFATFRTPALESLNPVQQRNKGGPRFINKKQHIHAHCEIFTQFSTNI